MSTGLVGFQRPPGGRTPPRQRRDPASSPLQPSGGQCVSSVGTGDGLFPRVSSRDQRADSEMRYLQPFSIRVPTRTVDEPIVPSRVLGKVGLDLFHYHGQRYLITVDYLSGFFEVDRLPSQRIKDIVYALKHQFSRYGIPSEVMSDNSPFAAEEFQAFARAWEFKTTTSSPNYPRSNGKVENAVKTAKRIMTKASAAGADVFLALLTHRNVPSVQLGQSPAKLLFGRCTRTLLPVTAKLLDTPTADSAREALTAAKGKQAVYHDKRARPRPPFSVGQTVRARFSDGDWRKAQVTQTLPHRSYLVRLENGSTRRRTSCHLWASAERPISGNEDSEEEDRATHDTEPEPAPASPPTGAPRHTADAQGPGPAHPPYQTRSGRVIAPPARYRDSS